MLQLFLAFLTICIFYIQDNLKITTSIKEKVEFYREFSKVKNTGKMDGDEVVQAYIQYPKLDGMPVKELKGFKRVSVTKGGEQLVTIKIPVKDLQNGI